MSRNLSGTKAKLLPASPCDQGTGFTHYVPAHSARDLRTVDAGLSALFVNNIYYRPPSESVSGLPQLPLFCFPEHGLDKVSTAQNSLIRCLSLTFSLHGTHLRPAA